MASSLPSVIDDTILVCRLCCRPSTEPTLLPCLHSFCKDCIKEYIHKYSKSHPISTPLSVAVIDHSSTETSPNQEEKAKRRKVRKSDETDGSGKTGHKKPSGRRKRDLVGPSVAVEVVDSSTSRNREGSSKPSHVVDQDGYEIPVSTLKTGETLRCQHMPSVQDDDEYEVVYNSGEDERRYFNASEIKVPSLTCSKPLLSGPPPSPGMYVEMNKQRPLQEAAEDYRNRKISVPDAPGSSSALTHKTKPTFTLGKSHEQMLTGRSNSIDILDISVPILHADRRTSADEHILPTSVIRPNAAIRGRSRPDSADGYVQSSGRVESIYEDTYQTAEELDDKDLTSGDRKGGAVAASSSSNDIRRWRQPMKAGGSHETSRSRSQPPKLTRREKGSRRSDQANKTKSVAIENGRTSAMFSSSTNKLRSAGAENFDSSANIKPSETPALDDLNVLIPLMIHKNTIPSRPRSKQSTKSQHFSSDTKLSDQFIISGEARELAEEDEDGYIMGEELDKTIPAYEIFKRAATLAGGAQVELNATVDMIATTPVPVTTADVQPVLGSPPPPPLPATRPPSHRSSTFPKKAAADPPAEDNPAAPMTPVPLAISISAGSADVSDTLPSETYVREKDHGLNTSYGSRRISDLSGIGSLGLAAYGLYHGEGSISSGAYDVEQVESTEVVEPNSINNSNFEDIRCVDQAKRRISRTTVGDARVPQGTTVDHSHLTAFNCPVCTELVPIDSNWNDQIAQTKTGENVESAAFLTPSSINSSLMTSCTFLTTLREMVSVQKFEPRQCSNCETKQAMLRCFDCHHDLCAGCREAHDLLKVTRGHRLVKLRDLHTGKVTLDAASVTQSSSSTGQPVSCPSHTNQSAMFVCITCHNDNVIVCNDCLAPGGRHAGHVTGSLGAVAARERRLVDELIGGVRTRMEDVKSESTKIKGYLDDCERQRSEVICSVEKQRDALIAMVNEHALKLVAKIRIECEQERCRLESKLTDRNRLQEKMHDSVKFSRLLVDYGRDNDVIAMTTIIRQNLTRLATAQLTSLVPTINGTDDMSSLSYKGQTRTKFPSRFHITFSPTVFEPDDISQLTGFLTCQRIPILQPQSADVTDDCVIGDLGPTVVMPRLVGSFATRTNSDAKGCKPTGMVLTSEDDIVLVDDINKKIKVFDLIGKLKAEFHPDAYQRLVDPWDVAILKSGSHLAVTDRGARDVKVFDALKGEFVFSFGRPHLGSPWGIAVNSEGHIIVTDTVHKKVFVHNSNGELLLTLPVLPAINTPNDSSHFLPNVTFKCPEYVAVNTHDDIIVSDFELHSVTIFDKFGRIISCYSGAKLSVTNPANKLKVPCGLTVDSATGNIFIADYNNRRIVELNESGNKLIRAYATNDAHLVLPQTLAFDSQRRLVVVDRTNVKIFELPTLLVTKREPTEKIVSTVSLERDAVVSRRLKDRSWNAKEDVVVVTNKGQIPMCFTAVSKPDVDLNFNEENPDRSEVPTHLPTESCEVDSANSKPKQQLDHRTMSVTPGGVDIKKFPTPVARTSAKVSAPISKAPSAAPRRSVPITSDGNSLTPETAAVASVLSTPETVLDMPKTLVTSKSDLPDSRCSSEVASTSLSNSNYSNKKSSTLDAQSNQSNIAGDNRTINPSSKPTVKISYNHTVATTTASSTTTTTASTTTTAATKTVIAINSAVTAANKSVRDLSKKPAPLTAKPQLGLMRPNASSNISSGISISATIQPNPEPPTSSHALTNRESAKSMECILDAPPTSAVGAKIKPEQVGLLGMGSVGDLRDGVRTKGKRITMVRTGSGDEAVKSSKNCDAIGDNDGGAKQTDKKPFLETEVW